MPAGKKTYAHPMAISDYMRCNSDMTMIYQARQALEQDYFSAVILDSDTLIMSLFSELVEQRSIAQRPVLDDTRAFWPKTGLKTRPATAYRLKEKSNSKNSF
jgi:hypothetical protein